jgi:hypothetical protein
MEEALLSSGMDDSLQDDSGGADEESDPWGFPDHSGAIRSSDGYERSWGAYQDMEVDEANASPGGRITGGLVPVRGEVASSGGGRRLLPARRAQSGGRCLPWRVQGGGLRGD